MKERTQKNESSKIVQKKEPQTSNQLKNSEQKNNNKQSKNSDLFLKNLMSSSSLFQNKAVKPILKEEPKKKKQKGKSRW